MATTRVCKRCNGSKVTVRDAFTYHECDAAGNLTGRSHDYPRRVDKCYACDGLGDLPEPDARAICAAIAGRGGKSTTVSFLPTKLCSKRPDDRRAYYVWRLARFHGGADVTMPMCATLDNGNDPWLPELDKLADAVAKQVFGTDLAAAHRWGRALGYLDRDMPGLPDSAYSGSRVADADKPEEELDELR